VTAAGVPPSLEIPAHSSNFPLPRESRFIRYSRHGRGLRGGKEKVPEILDKLEPKDRIQAILKMLEFVIARPVPVIEKDNQAYGQKNFFTELLENHGISLQRDLEWSNQKLREIQSKPPQPLKGE
jgi:hypothetical protein